MISEGDLLAHRVPRDPTAHMLRAADRDAQRRPSVVREVMSGIR